MVLLNIFLLIFAILTITLIIGLIQLIILKQMDKGYEDMNNKEIELKQYVYIDRFPLKWILILCNDYYRLKAILWTIAHLSNGTDVDQTVKITKEKFGMDPDKILRKANK